MPRMVSAGKIAMARSHFGAFFELGYVGGGRGPQRLTVVEAHMRTLCVEGWRFLHHSFAMINQWQLLSLLKRQDISLSVRDVPYLRSHWQPVQGLFTEKQERRLSSIPELAPDTSSDATLRIASPFDFS